MAFLNLNRTQKYLLESFCHDLSEEKFKDLKFVISKFFNTGKSLDNDVEFSSNIKDSFILLISNIISNYSFIISNYPNNPNLFLWQDRLEYYKKYELFLDTILDEEKLSVQYELDLIVLELKKVLNLSYILNKHI